jgi:hypothetical protein
MYPPTTYSQVMCVPVSVARRAIVSVPASASDWSGPSAPLSRSTRFGST